jgi:hypothetical protein
MLCELPPLTLLPQLAQATRSSIPCRPRRRRGQIDGKIAVDRSAGVPPLTSLARTIVTPPVVFPGHRVLMFVVGGAFTVPEFQSTDP